ncbi:hypothetical protein CTEN210_16336 [Chaetoceros tenuissimus]|uniref:Prolyl 4-hydroxylase alpha subunit domain-containing protein n=1 Tax=Chaetoceros tenuissimus TaxID=426638 RepID=A0AAD3DBE2_9STRA|nr:hypothetical protein CTEN210_16336 [Chaetoceros tenuissimus]
MGYSSEWANRIDIRNENDPIASYDVKAGDVLTLYPIDRVEFGVHECGRCVDLLHPERFPYPHLRNEKQELCIISENDSIRHGWLGNKIPMDRENKGNCAFVPLPSIAPLCAIVATRDIAQGESIKECKISRKETLDLSMTVGKRYAHGIGYLLPYLNEMAYMGIPYSREKQVPLSNFHTINTSYPQIQKIHSNPDIYTIPNFLSDEECDRLIAKASTSMKQSLIKTGKIDLTQPNSQRTSTEASIPKREAPTILNKITNLVNCDDDQVEILQVLNYKQGQEFKAHTDGFDSATSSSGYLHSGRIATAFCYLNDVETGGETTCTKLGLKIKPEKGLCVVHFPMTLDLWEDELTEHQGGVAIDEKWILTSFIWKHWKGDFRYDEDFLPSLTDDII